MSFQKKTVFHFGQTEEARSDSRAVAGDRPFRARLAKMLGRWIEILVLLLVVVSPWLFGGVEPIHEFWLFGLLAVAMVFWGLRVLLEGAVAWRPCPVAFCLLG